MYHILYMYVYMCIQVHVCTTVLHISFLILSLYTRLPSILPNAQVVVTKVTADYDRWALLKSNEPLIIQLQARLRGAKCRRAFSSRVDYLKAHEEQAVQLQVLICVRNIIYMYDVHFTLLVSLGPLEGLPTEEGVPGETGVPEGTGSGSSEGNHSKVHACSALQVYTRQFC